MKKQKFKYDIWFTTKGKLKLDGQMRDQTVVENITGLNLKGIKEALKERLDLAIKSGGEPYRPTVDDIKKSLGGSFYDSEKWLKKQTKIYQQAYDKYKSIVDTIAENESGRQETGAFCRLLSHFKPYSMSIEINVR